MKKHKNQLKKSHKLVNKSNKKWQSCINFDKNWQNSEKEHDKKSKNNVKKSQTSEKNVTT